MININKVIHLISVPRKSVEIGHSPRKIWYLQHPWHPAKCRQLPLHCK